MQAKQAEDPAWAANVRSLEQRLSAATHRNAVLEAKVLKVRQGVALLYATSHEHTDVCTVAKLAMHSRPTGLPCCK